MTENVRNLQGCWFCPNQSIADTDGITGFMYGCAVSTLSHVWEYGEELRKWHNGEYNHEGEGVVNPAVLCVKGE